MTVKEFYSALKSEIQTDPKTLGYSGQSDQWVVDKLNEVGASNETITIDSVTTSDIVKAIYSDADEFAGLTTAEVTKLNLLSPVGTIDPADLQAVFLSMFPVETRPITRQALIDLAKKPVSRAEKLGFPIVKLFHVENALHTSWWDV